MELTPKKISDYLFCPQKYDLIHNKKLITDRIATKNETKYFPYKRLLTSIIEGNPLTIDELKKECDKAFINKKVFNTSDVQKLWSSYIKVYDYFVDNKITILSLNQAFTTRLDDDTLVKTILDFPIIKYNANNKDNICLFNLRLSSYFKNLSSSYDSTLFEELSWYNNYALALVSNLSPISKLGLQYTGLQTAYVKGDTIQISKTVYHKDKAIRANRIMCQAAKGIKEQIYIPHMTPMCNSCEVKHFCKLY